ncbi:MAG: GNAT family N-acetyltransferase [Pseudomonadota bacterium]|nr:GNAT family N-acetyltransferase [Pseudomonadota bacterium]
MGAVTRAIDTALMATVVAPLQAHDRAAWEALARGYKAFYSTATSDAEYAAAWSRLLNNEGVFGLGAFLEGHLVGIAHYFFHTTVWTGRTCYLQDLFTAPNARGRGVARSLIEAAAAEALAAGATRYYWHTQESNAGARVLYDKVARHAGFIRYDYALRPLRS